jgi:hypothetical protein
MRISTRQTSFKDTFLASPGTTNWACDRQRCFMSETFEEWLVHVCFRTIQRGMACPNYSLLIACRSWTVKGADQPE